MEAWVREYELPLARPLRTAHGVTTARRIIEVGVRADGGIGLGEAAPLPGFGVESYDEALAGLERWAAEPDGMPPRTPCAAAAAESALTALDADLEGMSVAELLAGTPTTASRVAVAALVVASDPQEAAKAAVRAAAQGHLAVKLKVAAGSGSERSGAAVHSSAANGSAANGGIADGAAPPDPVRASPAAVRLGGKDAARPAAAAEVARIMAVRQALPAGVSLRLDANGGWDRAAAVWVLRRVGHLDIEFVEEPTRRPADWAQISRTCGLAIAADEHLSRPEALDDFIEAGAIEVAVAKPAVLGGPQAVYDLARRAAVRGVRTVVSSFVCGPAGLRIARDTALAVNPHGVHGIGTATLFADPLPDDVTPAGGYLHAPIPETG